MRKLFFVFLLTAAVIMAQAPPEPSIPPAEPDSLALTRVEIQDLKIADLELTKAQMEQALLQARFRELGKEIEQMKQSHAALEAKIIAARNLPASSRIDIEVKRVLPPLRPAAEAAKPAK